MRIVGYIFLLWSSTSWALVPIEGILMGEANQEYQLDPLSYIFRDTNDTSVVGENRKAKLYQSVLREGRDLLEQCEVYKRPVYATPWQETQAQRSVVAHLQYLGLDRSIKAIAHYSKDLEIPETSYDSLVTNLVKNNCSKNLTVMSYRNVERALRFYFKNPGPLTVPDFSGSPFVTEAFKVKAGTREARSREFDQVIKNFRAFCSWGGDVADLRMLVPYVKNPFIMAQVIQSLAGQKHAFNDKGTRLWYEKDDGIPRVVCRELVCRSSDAVTFKKYFPLSVGSTGLDTDLTKLYCHHFRMKEYATSNAQAKKWIKEAELVDPILETNSFLSLMTGVPDVIFGVKTYNELPLLVRSSVDARWNLWAKQVLSTFSKDLLFEESMKVKIVPNRDLLSLADGFHLDFTLTVGEIDRITDLEDKIGLNFKLKIPRNFLKSIRKKWEVVVEDVDEAGKNRVKQELANYIDVLVREKEKLFLQTVWTPDFARILSEELLGQALRSQGKFFEGYEEKMLEIPVKFSYGVFAMSYLKYRADVNAGRLKLNL